MKSRFSAAVLAYAGALIALNVILTRFVSIPIGQIFRISIGAVPIILASLWLGPVAGGICGFLGDLIGCAVGGYAPNPLISVSSVMVGMLPFCMKGLIAAKRRGIEGYLRFLLMCAGTFLITSQGLTVAGLSLMYGLPFVPTFISRIPQTAALAALDAFLVQLLYVRLPDPMKAGRK